MAVLSRLEVDLVNLHAAGTKAMMEAALEGLTRPDGTRPLLIAVTQLTSTDQQRMEQELLIEPAAAGGGAALCRTGPGGRIGRRGLLASGGKGGP